MKSTLITRLLTCKITNEAFDKWLATAACFVASPVVLVLSLRCLMRFDLTSAQLFFGVLLSGVTPLLLIVLGILMHMMMQIRTARKDAA